MKIYRQRTSRVQAVALCSAADRKWAWLARFDCVGKAQNLPGNFATIDRLQNGVATSSKSMDLPAPTYANAANITSTGRGVIDSVAGFQGRNWAGVNIRPGDITARGLDLAVPAGATQAQQQALQDLVNYGTHCGVNVRIVVVP